MANIILAHERPFRIGAVEVRPAMRTIARDGVETIVEPRVMQVLVALAQAEGAVISRDDLVDRCWEGRIVGDDAIHRITSRLRKLASDIGDDAFRIETVTRIGYRLVRLDGSSGPDDQIPPDPANRFHPSRRAVIAGGIVAAGAAATAGFWWMNHAPAPESVPADIVPMMVQGAAAYREGTPEGNNRSIGLFRQVVQRHPDYADGWGALGLAYSEAYWGRGARNDASMGLRAREALEHARALDPDNGYAALADVLKLPLMGNWLRTQRSLRRVDAAHPGNDLVLRGLASSLTMVGCWKEATPLAVRAVDISPTAPQFRYLQTVSLWSVGQLDEAERAIEQGLELFPSYYALWFMRFYIYLFTGRANEAITYGEALAGRPPGIPVGEFDRILIVARAMASPSPGAVDHAMETVMAAAHSSVGQAQNAMLYACAFGRIDTAFEAAEALYFARGFDPGELRWSTEQAFYTRRGDRTTYPLFMPPTAPMRADPRFDRLVEELGLKRYWRDSGNKPDYLKG